MITVLVADDHISVLHSLFNLLEASGDIEIVATALNGEEAVSQASLYCPDMALIDISMPVMDGIEATRQICELCPHTRVLILSMFDDSLYIQSAVQAGASGYVLKDEAADDLLPAMRTVYSGSQYFSQKVARFGEQDLFQEGNDSSTSDIEQTTSD